MTREFYEKIGQYPDKRMAWNKKIISKYKKWVKSDRRIKDKNEILGINSAIELLTLTRDYHLAMSFIEHGKDMASSNINNYHETLKQIHSSRELAYNDAIVLLNKIKKNQIG